MIPGEGIAVDAFLGWPISKAKPRFAVVSPFLDKGHGTQRIVLEWISRLPLPFLTDLDHGSYARRRSKQF